MKSFKQNLLTNAKIIILALVLAVGANYVYAWTGPTQVAPDGNTAAPLNVGTSPQVKNGGLFLNTLLVSGQVRVADGTQGAGTRVFASTDGIGTGGWVTPASLGIGGGVTSISSGNTSITVSPTTGAVVITANTAAQCAALGGVWGGSSCTFAGSTAAVSGSVVGGGVVQMAAGVRQTLTGIGMSYMNRSTVTGVGCIKWGSATCSAAGGNQVLTCPAGSLGQVSGVEIGAASYESDYYGIICVKT
jgi:hypothetical protein